MKRAGALVLTLALAGCPPREPATTPPPVNVEPSRDTDRVVPAPMNETSAAPDPCAAELTTQAIVACVTERSQQIEGEIQAALPRSAAVLAARGIGNAAARVAASQTDWERYRSSQCQLFEKLSEGGSMARIDVAYCRRDLSAERLAHLRSLEQSVVE
jgi:uncharacterized protein YecT (DUF1311 family)